MSLCISNKDKDTTFDDSHVVLLLQNLDYDIFVMLLENRFTVYSEARPDGLLPSACM